MPKSATQGLDLHHDSGLYKEIGESTFVSCGALCDDEERVRQILLV
jgi:hypothetical protein